MAKSNVLITIPTDLGYQLNNIKGATNAARVCFPLREHNTVNHGGSGSVKIIDAVSILSNKDSDWYVMKNIRPILKKWDGVFWRLTDEWILLYSPQAVAEKLGLDLPTGHVTFIPVDNFRKIKTTRASLWAGFPNKVNTPISQYKLREVTGVPQSTQRTYLKELDFPYTINTAIYEYAGKKIEWNPQLQKTVSEFRNCFPQKVDGKYFLATRLPSEYRQPFKTGFRKGLRSSKRGRDYEKGSGSSVKFVRVFYGSKENDDDSTDMHKIKFYSKHNSLLEQQEAEKSVLYEIFGYHALDRKRTWRAILPFVQDWQSAMSNN